MSAQAFIDESARGSSYHVCVAVVANGDVDSMRRVVRSFCLPGQRRWHFVNERDSRRKQILDAIVDSGQVSALAFYGTGRDNDIRAESFRLMVQPLLDRGVTRLIIESRQGRDDLDRQVLIDQLRRHGAAGFRLRPSAAPCRPAVVDCGRTRVVLVRRRVLARSHRHHHIRAGRHRAVESAKPGRSPSGEEPGSLPEAQRNRLSQVYVTRGLSRGCQH